MLAAVVGLGSLALFLGLLAWAIASMRSKKRLDDPSHRGRGASIGDAFLEVHSLIEPDKRHVIEQRRAEVHDASDTGEPPEDEPGRR